MCDELARILFAASEIYVDNGDESDFLLKAEVNQRSQSQNSKLSEAAHLGTTLVAHHPLLTISYNYCMQRTVKIHQPLPNTHNSVSACFSNMDLEVS